MRNPLNTICSSNFFISNENRIGNIMLISIIFQRCFFFKPYTKNSKSLITIFIIKFNKNRYTVSTRWTPCRPKSMSTTLPFNSDRVISSLSIVVNVKSLLFVVFPCSWSLVLQTTKNIKRINTIFHRFFITIPPY